MLVSMTATSVAHSKLKFLEGRDVLGSYPIVMSVQPSAPQNPNTPKLTPPKLPRGIALIIGAERTASNIKAKAPKSSIDRGVAGRNIVTKIQGTKINGVRRRAPASSRRGDEEECVAQQRIGRVLISWVHSSRGRTNGSLEGRVGFGDE